MSGLREALERLLAEWSERAEGYAEYRELRALLAAHPAEPPPVASRERVAEVLSSATREMDYKRWETPQGMLPFADALLAAGVFRDEAQVKAEALEELAARGYTTTGIDRWQWPSTTQDRIREAAAMLRAGGSL